MLLGTGQVAKSLTEAVHRQKTVTRIDIAESSKRTREFAPLKA
jgi:ubiquinone/menaquinone biosynthesis C-methylase UbiE